MTIILNWVAMALGVGGVVAVLGLVMKKLLPESRINAWGDGAEKIGALCGRVVTLNISEWSYIGKAWNKVIEPFVILLLVLPVRWLKGFVGRHGLLTDNPK